MPAAPPLPRPALRDHAAVRALCERLVPGGEAVVLQPQAPRRAKPRDCVVNVDAMIHERGGDVEYGWALWETFPGVIIEAEFHAVWRDPRGRRRDVTPQQIEVSRVVFLPDPTLVYEDRQIDNERIALIDDPLVEEFISAAKAHFDVTNRGELATFHGELPRTPEIRAATQRRWDAERQLLAKHFGVSMPAKTF